MNTEQIEFVKTLWSIGAKLGIITVEDLQCLTAPQLLAKIIGELDKLLESQNDLIEKVDRCL